MQRVETLEDLEHLLDVSGSCLFGKAREGHATPDETITALEDFSSGRVTYYADPSHRYGYIRAFAYDGELIVDFGRPLEMLADNIGDLARDLDCPIVIPLIIPGISGGRIPHLDVLPVTRDTRAFLFGLEHPHYRVSFPTNGEYAVSTLDPNDC